MIPWCIKNGLRKGERVQLLNERGLERSKDVQRGEGGRLLTAVLGARGGHDGGKLAREGLLGPEPARGVEELGELGDGSAVAGGDDEDVPVVVAASLQTVSFVEKRVSRCNG